MSGLQDIDAGVANLGQVISTFAVNFKAAIDALQAKIASGQDTSAEVKALADMATTMQALDDQAKAIIALTNKS